MNKKFIIATIASIMTFSSITFADDTVIKDIDKSSAYAKNAIQYLAEQKVISGDQNGNFYPQKSVTRAEMVALMAKAMKLDTSNSPEIATFKDVPADNWAAKYVEAAYKEGIVTGVSAEEFKPNDKITREQMAVIFVRALKLVDKNTAIELNNIYNFTDNERISAWAQKEAEVAIEAGLMNGVSNSSFEPKTAANKEQSAVVIERLIKNKETITAAFKAQTQNENAVKVTLNNESIILNNNIVVQDNKVFIPVEFLNRFILSPAVYDIDEAAKVVELIPAPGYKASGVDKLWLSVGNNKAYKNLEENPFTSANAPAENTINLSAAPIQLEGKTYIPLADIAGVFGMNHEYASEKNELSINNAVTGKSANLYFALKQLAYNDYIGELRAKGSLKLTDTKTKHYSKMSYDMYDKQNDNYTTWSYTKEIVEASGQATATNQAEAIVIDKKRYDKDFKDSKWVKTDLSNGLTYVFAPFFDPIYENEEIKSAEMNIILFENLNKIDIKNEGAVYISGIPATKYAIELNADTIKNIMSAEDYTAVKELADKVFQGKLNYKYEFYVANNTVIKQSFEFDGNTINQQTGNTVNYHSNSAIYYKNIGKKSIIEAPPASAVKAAQN